MVPHLTPIIEGNDTGETIVFIQGWPDDASLWNGAVTALRERYRCVRMTLPNYGGDRTARWGYSTVEIVEALERLVREAGGGERVTLVLHDWGCYWGHALHHRNPDLVARVAGVNVAPHYAPTLFAMSGIVAYQAWLFGAFAAGGPVGDAMTRGFAKLARAGRRSTPQRLDELPLSQRLGRHFHRARWQAAGRLLAEVPPAFRVRREEAFPVS